jgi:hypothetical protein
MKKQCQIQAGDGEEEYQGSGKQISSQNFFILGLD